MTRLSVVGKPQLHQVPYKAKDPKKQKDVRETRGILEVELELPDKNILTVFVVHLPSGGSSNYLRIQAVEFLNGLLKKLPKDRMALVGGDFNININDEKTAQMYTKQLGKAWLVSHLIGCKECQGTHYYHTDRSWSFLDAILFSPNLGEKSQAPWQVLPSSIAIHNKSEYQNNQYGSPARYVPEKSVGVSDHWPLVVRLAPRN